MVHCCGSSACGARLVAQRCVVCTAVVAVRQLHSWPRPGAFWALLLDHLKSCENPTSSPAGARPPARGRGGRGHVALNRARDDDYYDMSICLTRRI